MANALRNNRVALQQCCWYAPTTIEVELGAIMHQSVSGTSRSSVSAWVDTLDLLGWGLEVKNKIYVVIGDDLERHLKHFGLVDDGGKAITFSEWTTPAQDRAGWLKLFT